MSMVFARARRKLIGYLVLTTLLLKMVAPALSHTFVNTPEPNDRWLVAICTSTGLKYIALSPSDSHSAQESHQPDPHAVNVDHCLICTSSDEDVFLVSRKISSGEFGRAQHQQIGQPYPEPHGPSYWRSAHPRAPPKLTLFS